MTFVVRFYPVLSNNQSDSSAQIPVMDVMDMGSHVSFTHGRGGEGGGGAGAVSVGRTIYCRFIFRCLLLGNLSKSLRLALIRLLEVNFPQNVTLRICVGCIKPLREI